MIKQTLTPTRINRVKESLSVMAVMAKAIQMEYYADMDVRFKNPQVNMFASRIIKDAEAISHHLKHNGRASIEITNKDFVEDYSAEIHRVIHYFMKLPLSQVKEVMDNLDRVKEAVEV